MGVRAPFVFDMKKYQSFIATTGLGVLCFLYVGLVTPSLDEPVTIAGFFVLASATIMAAAYILLRKVARRSRRTLWAALIALYGAYLIALGSLNAASFINVLIATTVLGAILFVLGRSDG